MTTRFLDKVSKWLSDHFTTKQLVTGIAVLYFIAGLYLGLILEKML